MDEQQYKQHGDERYRLSTVPEGLEQAIWYKTPLLGSDVSILEPMAWEELMCRKVGLGHPPVIHMWTHSDAMTIGLRDRRLSGAVQAMELFRQEGTSVAVRASGGAAVPLHRGILNLSIMLPNPRSRINIHDDFRFMAEWISRAVHPWTTDVQTGEVEGAFCPGDYDIGIHGRKFCGIAQRRQAKAYMITAFVIVNGHGDELAAQIRRFYDLAAGPEDADKNYPIVRSGTMGGLDELAGVPSVESYMEQLQKLLNHGQLAKLQSTHSVLDEQEVQKTMQELRTRYDD
ncbi:lipoate--protein ligase family protein [Paenibacillus kandeliae]|uniref:lipoate--protein ligase family protein n=1 Tax=Paenibacillus kandeliae TaxID=3231269 RepID=UPI00345B4080